MKDCTRRDIVTEHLFYVKDYSSEGVMVIDLQFKLLYLIISLGERQHSNCPSEICPGDLILWIIDWIGY